LLRKVSSKKCFSQLMTFEQGGNVPLTLFYNEQVKILHTRKVPSPNRFSKFPTTQQSIKLFVKCRTYFIIFNMLGARDGHFRISNP